MAPRGRSKKARLRRIDAAFDAIAPLGFSKGVIEKTIKNLLKVYGGDEGWVFIEEASYKVVIENILEQQEEPNNMLEMEVDGGDNSRALEITEQTENVNDSMGLETSEPLVDAGEASLQLDAIPAANSGSGELALAPSGELTEDHIGGMGGEVINSPSDITTAEAEPRRVTHAQVIPGRKRPPCYGWISASESESEEES